MFGARMGARKESKVFFYKDPEGAFGIESATRRGSFWTRIRWGKVRCSEPEFARDMKEQFVFF